MVLNTNNYSTNSYFLWAAFDTYEFQAGYSGNWGLYHIDFNDTLKPFDTYEFQAGYYGNWGLYHIDFNDTLKRIPTDTAKWYKKYLTSDLRH
ncbi:hypothetical protein RYX36_000311 [Vicia faba]